MTRSTVLLASSLLLVACKSGPEVRPDIAPPSLPQEDVVVVTQNLTQVDIKYTGTIEAGGEAVTVDHAAWEFVVDGEVKRSGDKKLGLSVPAGGKTDLVLEETLAYVKDEAELKAMDSRGGSLLLALRGTLFLNVATAAEGDKPAGTRVVELPFAKSREVRTPRLPHLKLVDYEAGKFSEAGVEVQAVFHLGVVNPNPFEISLSGLDFVVSLAGKEVGKGTLGVGDRVSPSSTGVFDVTATLNEESHGKEAAKIIKSLVVPWVLTGTMRSALALETLESKGEIKLKK